MTQRVFSERLEQLKQVVEPLLVKPDSWGIFCENIRECVNKSNLTDLLDTYISSSQLNGKNVANDVTSFLKEVRLQDVEVEAEDKDARNYKLRLQDVEVEAEDKDARNYTAADPSNTLKQITVVNHRLQNGGVRLVDWLTAESTSCDKFLFDILEQKAADPFYNPMFTAIYQSLFGGVSESEQFDIANKQDKQLFELIVQPFAYLALAEYMKPQQTLTVEQCCQSFGIWFECYQDFFVDMWCIQEEIRSCEEQILNINNNGDSSSNQQQPEIVTDKQALQNRRAQLSAKFDKNRQALFAFVLKDEKGLPIKPVRHQKVRGASSENESFQELISLFNNNEIWESFLSKQIDGLKFGLEPIIKTFIAFEHSDSQETSIIMKRIGHMKLSEVQFTPISDFKETHQRTSDTYFAHTGPNLDSNGVYIVDCALRHDVRLYPQLKKKQAEAKHAGQAEKTLKDALAEIADKPELDATVMDFYKVLIILIGKENILGENLGLSDQLVKQMLNTIVSPFIYRLVYDSRSDQSNSELTAQQRCGSEFITWLNQHKDFFTYMWKLQQVVQAACQLQNESPNHDEKSVKGKGKQRVAMLQYKFAAAQQFFFDRFFSDAEHYQQGFGSQFDLGCSDLHETLIQEMIMQHRLQTLQQVTPIEREDYQGPAITEQQTILNEMFKLFKTEAETKRKQLLADAANDPANSIHLLKAVKVLDDKLGNFDGWLLDCHADFLKEIQKIKGQISECQLLLDGDEKEKSKEDLLQVKHQQKAFQNGFTIAQQFFVDSFLSAPVGFDSQFKFEPSRSFRLAVQHWLNKLHSTYEFVQEAESKSKERQQLEMLSELLGINAPPLVRSRLKFPQNTQIELKLQAIHQAFYPILLKAKELFEEGKANLESFALIGVCNSLKVELDNLANQLLLPIEIDDAVDDDKKSVPSHEESIGEDRPLSDKQIQLMSSFLTRSDEIFTDALEDKALQHHRNLFSRVFSKLYDFFCKIIHSEKRFDNNRVVKIKKSYQKLHSMFSPKEASLSSGKVEAKGSEPLSPPPKWFY